MQITPIKQDRLDFRDIGLNAVRRDTVDFNDKLYTTSLLAVPLQREPQRNIPVLSQGDSAACTGYALASVIHFLLSQRNHDAVNDLVSAEMIYTMSKRYDEWSGTSYNGSSARGAMKAWHKHGVCPKDSWHGRFSAEVARGAAACPLGAYYRVNHKDLVSVHSAIAETGILYATANVHAGWNDVTRQNNVIWQEEQILGSHAFVITGYDKQGLYLQNSWGETWGDGGIAKLTYDDWLDNAMDLWVAALAVPVNIRRNTSVLVSRSFKARQNEAAIVQDLNPHILSLSRNGLLQHKGAYATELEDFNDFFDFHVPEKTANWETIRFMLYAHGGLVNEETVVKRLSEYLVPCMNNQVLPMMISWNSDGWTTINNILAHSFSPRSKDGVFIEALDYLFDRIDDTIEPLARPLGRRMWDEMKNNAFLAAGRTADMQLDDGMQVDGALRTFCMKLFEFAQVSKKTVEIHLVGHSAGSIVFGPVIDLARQGFKGKEVLIKSCTLWAPACTLEFFDKFYRPSIDDKLVDLFKLFTLSTQVEKDDNCANLYHKSLLYLISNAFEDSSKIDHIGGVPILGMSKFISNNSAVEDILQKNKNWIVSPNDTPCEPPDRLFETASKAKSHGDFDNDRATLISTLFGILGKEPIFTKDFNLT